MSDFPRTEFETRTEKAQALMQADALDALLFCTEAEIRYFTGFRTLFWQSPTRPWFLILPRSGQPIAVIPEIGAELMRKTWVEDIRTWPAPRPRDDGVSLLVDALRGYRGIGLPMGEEASLRMPLLDFETLRSRLYTQFRNCTALVKALRMIKSSTEIALIREICAIGSAAFARAPELFHRGQHLTDVFRVFKIALLEAGAEDVPYLVGGAGPGGYGDIISPPSRTPLAIGDVLMLDTGACRNGYYCDFDRNFAIERADPMAERAHRQLWQATEAALHSARPGMRACDLFDVMYQSLEGRGSAVGRFGHGLGMQLTEWPSLSAADDTVLAENMVITLEPSLAIDDKRMMVHEENILITDGRPMLLTKRAPPELPVL